MTRSGVQKVIAERISSQFARSSETLVSNDFWCSSSVELGSFISLNILQGSSAHWPQSLKFFVFTEQSYSGQTFAGIISFAQKVEPLTFLQPVHVLLKNSHSSQINPHAESTMG